MGSMERPPVGGITWTIAGERLAILAWPRAILLQMAHPLVAAGVAQHSGFRDTPLAPFDRLRATVGAMRQLTFGTDEEAAATLRRIAGVHDRVNGTLHAGAGVHASGTRYSAHDPALLLWVHATLVDSHVRVLEPILRTFTPDERDRYCREAAPYAVLLGRRRRTCRDRGPISRPSWPRRSRTASSVSGPTPARWRRRSCGRR